MKNSGGASEPPREAGWESVAGQAFPWLLRQKITVPDRVAGYVHRDELESRTMPTRRRLTVLKAAGGFGKTALLAECCRKLHQDGVPTAWVSLDEQDEPAVLDTYIAVACQSAGLDLLDVSDPEGTSVGPESRVGVVLREIQALGKPFVIAFDELERLRNPASVSLLEFLLQRGPPNLHLAIACRQIPDGLNVAGAVLDGWAELVGTEELRFSKAEVARFFDLNLSRSDLAAEMERTAGWPFALRISHTRMEGGTEESTGVVQDYVKNWVESRLFADLGRNDRDFILDVGLFGWMDAALLDEVMERTDSGRRLQSMRVLVGLLEPVSGGATESWRLHPLVRDHCAERLFRENPLRFRAIHRRIAEALGGRGDTVAAMRHAVEAGEPVLAGEILERVGGVRLWIRQGIVQLLAADRWLSEEVISMRPRLALVRCVVLVMAGRLDEARQLLEQSQYMTMYGQLLRGQVAMAQGQVQDAESHYRTAQRIARKGFLLDPVSAPLAEVMLRELALECNWVSSAAALRNVPGALMKYGVPFSSFATASGLAIELRLQRRRIDQALAAADGLLEFVRDAGLTSLARYLAALRTSVLVIAGRVEAVRRARELGLIPDSGLIGRGGP